MQKKLEDGRINLIILVLKTKKLSKYLRQGSKLFHPIMVDRRKGFLKKLWYYTHFESSITGVWQESSCIGI